jgi:pimeloyl-ACP methyl ester carboxylesterase
VEPVDLVFDLVAGIPRRPRGRGESCGRHRRQGRLEGQRRPFRGPASRTGRTVNAPKLPYETGVVSSADGTPIGYRRLGTGPALILISGGYLAAQHYMWLASALADAFTVYMPDRRGRGMSGPPGHRYGVNRECEDVAALLAESGAEFLFGHSSGGLIALQAGLTLPQVRKLAVFEPPLSEHGSISSAWIGEFDRQVARGKPAAALAGFLEADHLVSAWWPRPLLVGMLALYLRWEKRQVESPDASIESLIPLQRLDGLLVAEMDSSRRCMAGMTAEVLLLGGEKSPRLLREVLDALHSTLSRSQRIELPRMGHGGPSDDGQPERVAQALRTFFAAA